MLNLSADVVFDSTMENSGMISVDSVDSGEEMFIDQIGQFISNIRECVTNKNLERNLQVEIEDLEPEENNAGVNPFRVTVHFFWLT